MNFGAIKSTSSNFRSLKGQLPCNIKKIYDTVIYAIVSQILWDRGPVNYFFIRRGPGPNKFTGKYFSNFFKFIY